MVASLAEAKTHPITPEAFLAFDAEIRTAKREKDDAGASFARAKKSAKNGAVDLLAYKFIEQMRRLDEDEQVIVCRHFMQYAQWLEMPIGTQFSMLDAPHVPPVKSKAKQEHELWAAGEAGLKAGREGDPASSNPHRLGTELHVAWSTKHSEGLTERATAAGMEDDDAGPVADAGRAAAAGRKGARRSRPRGSKTNGEMALGNARRHLGEAPVH